MDDSSVAIGRTRSNSQPTDPPRVASTVSKPTIDLSLDRLTRGTGDSPDQTRRIRLTLATTLLGIMLSIASFHVTVLARFQYFEEAVRIQGNGAIALSVAAALAALIVVPWTVYHVRDMAQAHPNPIVWLGFGMGFGVATPLLTGGFNRIAIAFAGLADGHYGILDLGSLLIDGIIIFPYDMFVQGGAGVFIGLQAGALFAVCGFVVDRLNSVRNQQFASIATWVVAFGTGLPILLFALMGPIDFLRDLA